MLNDNWISKPFIFTDEKCNSINFDRIYKKHLNKPRTSLPLETSEVQFKPSFIMHSKLFIIEKSCKNLTKTKTEEYFGNRIIIVQ